MRKRKLTYELPKEAPRCTNPGCTSPVSFYAVHLYSDETAELEARCAKGHSHVMALFPTEVPSTNDTKDIRIRTKISGVTFDNPDGTSRQTLLSHVKAGDPIQIVTGAVNDMKIFLVKHAIGVLGTIRGEYIREHFGVEPTLPIFGNVICTTGGEGEKSTRGCNIELSVNYHVPPPADSEHENKPGIPARPKHVYIDRDGRNIYHLDSHCSGMKNAKRENYAYAKFTLKARACKKCAAELAATEGE